jgi:hypothetical protein
MFRKNTKHQQPALISAVRELPEKHRQRLEQSWAGLCYREFFSRAGGIVPDRTARPAAPSDSPFAAFGRCLARCLRPQPIHAQTIGC